MSVQNVAIVIGPNLLWPPIEESALGMNMTATNLYSSIVDVLITYSEWFFPGDCEFYVSTPTCPRHLEGFPLSYLSGSQISLSNARLSNGDSAVESMSSSPTNSSPKSPSPRVPARPRKKAAPRAPVARSLSCGGFQAAPLPSRRSASHEDLLSDGYREGGITAARRASRQAHTPDSDLQEGPPVPERPKTRPKPPRSGSSRNHGLPPVAERRSRIIGRPSVPPPERPDSFSGSGSVSTDMSSEDKALDPEDISLSFDSSGSESYNECQMSFVLDDSDSEEARQDVVGPAAKEAESLHSRGGGGSAKAGGGEIREGGLADGRSTSRDSNLGIDDRYGGQSLTPDFRDLEADVHRKEAESLCQRGKASVKGGSIREGGGLTDKRPACRDSDLGIDDRYGDQSQTCDFKDLESDVHRIHRKEAESLRRRGGRGEKDSVKSESLCRGGEGSVTTGSGLFREGGLDDNRPVTQVSDFGKVDCGRTQSPKDSLEFRYSEADIKRRRKEDDHLNRGGGGQESPGKACVTPVGSPRGQVLASESQDLELGRDTYGRSQSTEESRKLRDSDADVKRRHFASSVGRNGVGTEHGESNNPVESGRGRGERIEPRRMGNDTGHFEESLLKHDRRSVKSHVEISSGKSNGNHILNNLDIHRNGTHVKNMEEEDMVQKEDSFPNDCHFLGGTPTWFDHYGDDKRQSNTLWFSNYRASDENGYLNEGFEDKEKDIFEDELGDSFCTIIEVGQANKKFPSKPTVSGTAIKLRVNSETQDTRL